MLAGVKVIPRDQLHSDPDTSDSDSSSQERKRSGSKKGKHVRRRKKSPCSYDSSSDGDGSRHHGGRTKHGKKRRNKAEDDGKEPAKDDKELERKELGLEWMLNSLKTPAKKSAEVCDDAQAEHRCEKEIRSNPNELNPYFKDNGSGFPDDTGPMEGRMDQRLPSSVVGDGGASWRLKALKRAREQAAREGRILDEVVEERWGSLGQLAASVASRRAAHARAHLHAIKDRVRGGTENSETNTSHQMKGGVIHVKESDGVRRDYLKDVSSYHPEMKKPSQNQILWRKRKGQNSSEGGTSLVSNEVSRVNKYANDGSFMDEIIHRQSKDAGVSTSTSNVVTDKGEPRDAGFACSKNNDSSPASLLSKQGLNPNQVAAKVLQLRLKGKHEEAEKLTNKAMTTNSKPDTGVEAFVPNTRGTSSKYIGLKASKERKEEEDADVYLAQKIVQNKQYSMSARADDEYDFGDAPTKKGKRNREGVPDEKTNVLKRFLTQQERCQFCFESPNRPKHLVVSIANFTYMMLPQWKPVVQGHCCILPLQHESATRSIDDDVWDEMRNFKKCLIMMFDRQDKDVLFLETVMGLAKQRRHCLVECIPLPRDVAKEAPLYFKKAIDEAEEEWSQHNAKKLIDTSKKGLRRSVPKDFPYFHVEFGLNMGFAHVIDDESKFRSNFGLNVIRGMMQLPEEDMYRKRERETDNKMQRQAVADFRREWEPFDWTKQLET